MKILIVAYACEPGKGSEQGTGWNLAFQLAKHHEVTVVTRANNQGIIEEFSSSREVGDLSFQYHDLSKFILRLKRSHLLPVQVYYALWLKSVAVMLAGKTDEFDVVHHLTFNSFEVPPMFLGETKAMKVWGPIGGGQIASPSLTVTLGLRARIKEWLRGKRVKKSTSNSSVIHILKKCDLVLFANHETRELLERHCLGNTGVMVDVGVEPALFPFRETIGSGTRILFAGKFEPRKGARLLLEAFYRAKDMNADLELRMVGDGPEIKMEQRWIAEHGLDQHVTLAGRLSHAEMASEFAKADIFVFPSLRDTTGAIALEAMATGVPVICLDHQGARLMVGDDCGIRVPVRETQEVISRLAEAMVALSRDSERRAKMGRAARSLCEEQFSWENKKSRILGEYQELMNRIE